MSNELNVNGLNILVNKGGQKKELVKKYVVNVFSDYSISIEQVNIPLDLPGAIRAGSVRIAQTISILMTMEKEISKLKKNGTTINYVKIYNRALSAVSTELGIGVTSVRDKVERQLSMSAKDLVQLLEKFFEQGDMTLRDILLNSVIGTIKEHEDTQAIYIYFSKNWF